MLKISKGAKKGANKAHKNKKIKGARIIESELKRLENLDFYKANIVLGRTKFRAFFKDLIPALKTAKIDLIMSSMTITDERKKAVDFSIPYAKANLAILTPLNSDITNIKDLDKKGKVLALKRGSTGHLYAVKNLKNATINLFDKENAAILEVIQGKADGFFYDQLTIYRTWQKHQDATRAILAPFQENPEFWGIAVQKGNAELKKELDEFIAESKKDGLFDSLGEKYLKDVKDTFKKNNLEFFF